MKTNHRRNNPKSYVRPQTAIYRARRSVGLTYDHDNGHRGAALDVRQAKDIRERRNRHNDERRLREIVKDFVDDNREMSLTVNRHENYYK